jgi:hypothetical protein
MFRQVVATALRLSAGNADRWLDVSGSRPVPAYGFERMADPPPLAVDTLRLLGAFHEGSLALADTWRAMLAPATAREVLALATEAGRLVDAADARGGHGAVATHSPESRTEALADLVAAFSFPDDLWAQVVYDLIVTTGSGRMEPDAVAAALAPVYLGRVGSLVVETRRMTAEEAEDRVEAQARAFERLKPSLVERWRTEVIA